ncbi:MAG TPA: serine/threonine-protein kinase, partial [Polyangiaceae bacterium]|nr:serine/threonine-protein kinase [Polyangiaceae bacterium]
MNLDQTSVATSTSRKYRVLTELGCGGMGRVYLAVHQGLAGFNKLVVLKVLRNDLATSSESRDSFLREARVSARMSHPNVVAVNEVEERDGVPIIVMEYLQGQPVSSLLRRLNARVPRSALLRVLSDSLSGLHYAHELTDFDGSPLRLVHRDFTPQNIFVTYDGSVKVLDFGIAQVTRAKAHSRSST